MYKRTSSGKFNYPSTGGTNVKSIVKCSHCNFNGYTREQGYKLIGYLLSWNKREKSS